MASTSWEDIIAKLQQDPQLTQDFAQVYPQGYSEDTITDAIAEFEKTLTTPNSPFDHYLKGETQALTTSQQKAWRYSSKINVIPATSVKILVGSPMSSWG